MAVIGVDTYKASLARVLLTSSAQPSLAGVAPIPASSGQRQHLRLNRGGNRQLNRALYSIALVQSWHYPPAKTFLARKRREGKTWREAMRALKRHLARVVFKALCAPQQGPALAT